MRPCANIGGGCAVVFAFGLAVAVLTAAPVPKQAPPVKPTKLTNQLLAGHHSYEWSSMLGGWIRFDANGSYTAQHYPDSTTVYSGTYFAAESSITITEWGCDTATGRAWGPSVYRFDVDMSAWPTLPGKSTFGFGFDVQTIPQADIHLKLYGKK